MPITRFLRLALALLGCAYLHAQPSLQQLWAKHDHFVMEGDPKPLPIDPSCSFIFKGKHGQKVRGWDVGDPKAPVVLWWQGGPGSEASPQYDAFLLGNPQAFRHLEIDQPGTGESAWVPSWKPENTVDDAITFLRQRGIKAPVIVTGWSWGSTMALLFAQRHPEWVRGVVVGGVWANSAAEVRRYMDSNGTRWWMPGLSNTFRAFSNGKGTACDLHQAIRQGRGGVTLARAYEDAESLQCSQGTIPRNPHQEAIPSLATKPVDMAKESDETVRFAFIESEMMCRGQRNRWRLIARFPKALATVPLIVIQGRYDQVCDPEVARHFYRSWPGTRKLFVPMNGGHGSFYGPGGDARTKAGLQLSPEQEQQLRKAISLHFGNAGYLHGAAIDCLSNP